MLSYPTLSMTWTKIICVFKGDMGISLLSSLSLLLSLSPLSLSSSPLLSWIPPLTTWHICEDKRFSKVLVIDLKTNRCTMASRCKISCNITPVLFLKSIFSHLLIFSIISSSCIYDFCGVIAIQNNWIKFAII